MMLLGLALLLANPAITKGRPTIGWTRLPSVPNSNGLASPFAGVSSGALIVAGGSNFPGKKPWQGGQKRWYDDIFALTEPGGRWHAVGRLPQELCYGVSATYKNGVVCVGGNNGKGTYSSVFCIVLKDQTILRSKLPSLPIPLANACGALVANTLYVAGGQQDLDSKAALDRVFCLDLSKPASQWREIAPIPGPARILAVAASLEGSFYVASGAELVPKADGSVGRRYLRDAYRYAPNSGWRRIADLPRAAVAAPSPAPIDGSGLYVLGGDDGTHVGFKPPESHPGFAKDVLYYRPSSNSWLKIGTVGAARVTAPTVHWKEAWIVVNGEMRPGVRSPQVWSVRIR